jgi:hypothetical protein
VLSQRAERKSSAYRGRGILSQREDEVLSQRAERKSSAYRGRGILSQREDEVFSQRAQRMPSARLSPPSGGWNSNRKA